MHAVSSYRGNRPTNTQTHAARQPQTGPKQYTAPLCLARSVIGPIIEMDLQYNEMYASTCTCKCRSRNITRSRLNV